MGSGLRSCWVPQHISIYIFETARKWPKFSTTANENFGYILRFNDFTFIQLQKLDCPTSSPSSNFRNAERSGFLFPFFAAPLVSIPSTFRVIPAALDVVASGESSDSKTTIHPLPKFECETLFRIFLKKKHTKKWKVIFGKMMCTTSICFIRSRPLPYFTHFGLRGRDLFHFHQIIPKNPESKPPNPGIWK